MRILIKMIPPTPAGSLMGLVDPSLGKAVYLIFYKNASWSSYMATIHFRTAAGAPRRDWRGLS
jgi:hypothetical protein